MNKFTIAAVMLAMLACGTVPLVVAPPESVNKPTHVNTPIPQAAESTAKTAIVTASETVWVREDAGSEYKIVYVGGSPFFLRRGEPVTVLACSVSSDMGLWAQIEQGYVNADFLSAGVCD